MGQRSPTQCPRLAQQVGALTSPGWEQLTSDRQGGQSSGVLGLEARVLREGDRSGLAPQQGTGEDRARTSGASSGYGSVIKNPWFNV